MVHNGYEDHVIANFISYRFLAVMMIALPLGLFIRGRVKKPFFLFAAVTTPTISLLIIYAISVRWDAALYWLLALWGISYTGMQIPVLPFVLANSSREQHTEAIAGFFLTNHASTALCGIVNFFLTSWIPWIFDEKLLLQMFAILGFGSLYFVLKINVKEKNDEKIKLLQFVRHYDWNLIIPAVVPTLLIAVGAGLTIPFVNLFFLNVHNMEADAFSLLASCTFALVTLSILLTPALKRRYGYSVAVTGVQTVSVAALVLLACTEFYNFAGYAIYFAGFFYLVRQPLMNIAGPVTSEVSMYYVGRRNRELISAIQASIWSGSWFISAQIFRVLRAGGMSYAGVFLITAALYSVGVIGYHLLIKDFERRKRAGKTDLEF